MRRLGQHFLINRSVIKKIVDALELKRGETVIEIGAGHGELTVPLARVSHSVGARVIAIEKDPRLAKNLEYRIEDVGLGKNVEIVNADARNFLRSFPASYILNPQSYKIVGNLPYYLTGRLLRLIGELEHKPTRSVFTIQREVAERLSAVPPRANRLSASVQFWAEPEILDSLSPEDFRPPPRVRSAIVQLKVRDPRDTIPSKEYDRLVTMLYQQPRKTVLNNLAHGLGIPRGELLDMLARASIKPDVRPQDLSVDTLVQLARVVGGE